MTDWYRGSKSEEQELRRGHSCTFASRPSRRKPVNTSASVLISWGDKNLNDIQPKSICQFGSNVLYFLIRTPKLFSLVRKLNGVGKVQRRPGEAPLCCPCFKASCRQQSFFFFFPSEMKETTPLKNKQTEKQQKPVTTVSNQSYSTNTRSCRQWKASFPIFWLVSQHCYKALLCIRAIIYLFFSVVLFSFYSTMNGCQVKEKKKQRNKKKTKRTFRLRLLHTHLLLVLTEFGLNIPPA